MFSNPANYTIYNAFNYNILAIISKVYFFSNLLSLKNIY